jgi:acyl-CoA synthetase (AMP-forming)/AMP-acid ligase II/acyl carrier protein
LTLVRLVETRAAQAGDRVAIEAPDREPLTYAALARQMREAAAELRALGISPRDRVALVLPNGPEAASCFLAVAATAAAAPLNPDYVEDELDFYFESLAPRAVMVMEGASGAAVAAAKARGIGAIGVVPGARAGEFRLSPSAPALGSRSPPSAQDTALLLHTSGTTARPKLVPLSHANLMASARAVAETLALGPEDVCLNVLPLFHIHGLVAALLASLVGGGRIACTPGFHPLRFFDWLEAFRPTWYTAVPTMHQAILARAGQFPEQVARARLRFVRSSSAALPPKVMEGLERLFRAPVIEAYGMTEAAHQMASNPLPPAARKPGTVGRAAGPEIRVLGAKGKFAPPGERGEVVIRGPGVMAGYVGDPEANACAFVKGWFRTGDEGALDEDGYLTITGRLKEVINRGGEKIAPREVDEVLLDHPCVVEAVTFAVPDAALGEEVGAAVVLKPGAEASASDLKAFAAERLAYFKVPRHLVILESLPKGATGKIQRVGLAHRLGLERVESKADETPPRTATETELARIWAGVLRVPRVGMLARFLDLGGDSILAAELIARVREDLGVALTLTDVFDTPTVGEMAVRIEERRSRVFDAAWPPILPRAETGPAPLSFSQDWWLSIEDRAPPSAASNRPSSLRLRGPLDAEALKKAFAAVVDRHESLRTVFVKTASGRMQRVLEGFSAALETADLSTHDAPVEAARAAILEGAREPFDLAAGPPCRARLLRLADDDHVLLFVVHHVVFDGWSMAVLTRDLAALYGALAKDEPSPLTKPKLRYADFAAWQRAGFSGPRREGLLKSWRQLLEGLRPTPLPADRARPHIPSLSGGTVRRLVPAPVMAAARALGAEENATLYMTCLACFHLLLGRLGGVEDVATGCLVNGRTTEGTQDLVGLFFNPIVMRTDLSGDPSVRALVSRVRCQAVAALAHQDMPIGELVQALGLSPGAGDSPAAPVNVLFQMRNFPPPRADAAGVRFRAFKTESGMARFDLTFDLEEGDDGLSCVLAFNRDLFDGATCERLLADFAATLEAMVAKPDAPVSALSLPPLRARGGA